MEGTAARVRSPMEDASQIQKLRESPKEIAENLMITDMLRNDLGRVAQIGSVTVHKLFEVECYPTLLQMTSTVSASTKAPIADIMASMFPCASVTGAPKVRTMQIIRELETRSLDVVYTGAIGFISPGRQTQFSVAIRTVLIDRSQQQAIYGIGSGLIWDSNADDEYAECLLKSSILTYKQHHFKLIEAILWYGSLATVISS